MSAVYTVDGALAAVGVHETGQRRGRIKAGILLACESGQTRLRMDRASKK